MASAFKPDTKRKNHPELMNKSASAAENTGAMRYKISSNHRLTFERRFGPSSAARSQHLALAVAKTYTAIAATYTVGAQSNGVAVFQKGTGFAVGQR